MFKDLKNGFSRAIGLAPQVKTADTNCTGVNRSGYEAVAAHVQLGDSGDVLAAGTNVSLELQHSDDDATYVNVPEEQMIGAIAGTTTGQFALIDAPAEDQTIKTVGYVGVKKFVRVVLNFTGTHTVGIPVAVTYELGSPRHAS